MKTRAYMGLASAFALATSPVVAQAATTAAPLSVASATRAATPTANESNQFGDTPILAGVIVAGIIAIGVIAIVNDGDDDDGPDSF